MAERADAVSGEGVNVLCVNPRCRIPGRHAEGCAGNCRGCQRAWSADGLRLCPVCARRIGENAVKLGKLYVELELVLRPSGAGGRSSGKPGSASPPRDDVVATRTEIRHVLAGWCRVVSEERGLDLPADEVSAMGAYLRLHGDWLAASDYADEVSDELAGLVGRAWGLAYPNGTRRVRVGPCPRCGGVASGQWVVERLPAGFIGPPNRSGMLVAVVRDKDGKLPSEVYCDLVAEHEWDAPQWRQLDREVTARRKMAA